MFIAHLPAGYLTARLMARPPGGTATPALLLAGMAGGVFPDLDLVYGALVDGGRVHHHRYWPHLPLVWLAVTAIAASWNRAFRLRPALMVFLAAVWGHLLLDSVAGDIWWLWPWHDTPFSLVDIPFAHASWWMNYLLHWTFGLELAITAAACAWEYRHPALPRPQWRPA